MHRSELTCPSFHDHTPSPEGYIQWHAWASKMLKTHKQRKCTGCGLFAIWEPAHSQALPISKPKATKDATA
jgi:hypothetical protein